MRKQNEEIRLLLYIQILGFHSRDETAMLVDKPMAKCHSVFAQLYNQILKILFSLLFCIPLLCVKTEQGENDLEQTGSP